jgi:hypothetical protein
MIAIVLLYDNRHSQSETSEPLVYDAQAYGITANKISDPARIDYYRKCRIYGIASKDHNILMKYKGNGLLHCRNGTGMNRVGFFGYLQGQQYVDGMLDYRTNVNSMKVLMELSTS